MSTVIRYGWSWSSAWNSSAVEWLSVYLSQWNTIAQLNRETGGKWMVNNQELHLNKQSRSRQVTKFVMLMWENHPKECCKACYVKGFPPQGSVLIGAILLLQTWIFLPKVTSHSRNITTVSTNALQRHCGIEGLHVNCHKKYMRQLYLWHQNGYTITVAELDRNCCTLPHSQESSQLEPCLHPNK